MNDEPTYRRNIKRGDEQKFRHSVRHYLGV